MKPWLGAQEAHYASNLWHLEISGDYTSQMSGATGQTRVAPGKSLVDVGPSRASIPPGETAVNLGGHPEFWVTDIECATSMRPKLYGFDFARVQEVYEVAGQKRLVSELTKAARLGHKGHHPGGGTVMKGEHAMMRDLMISCLADNAEVCATYHMLNPTLHVAGNATSAPSSPPSTPPIKDVGSTLRLGGKTLLTHDLSTDTDVAALVAANCKRWGELLKAVLDHPLVDGAPGAPKTIYLRLLHEPNLEYFWWGEPAGYGAIRDANPTVIASDQTLYQSRFQKLWLHMVEHIEQGLATAERKAQVKFVFSINGVSRTNKAADNVVFQNVLNDYFPDTTATPSLLTPERTRFLNSIAVLGLDYYEDAVQDPAKSALPDQYDLLIARQASLASAGFAMEHALTEVSVRTDFKGRLYGEYNKIGPWPSSNRRFFEVCVFPIVKTKQPKWVMFWVNRLGNSVISALTPGEAGSGLQYGAGTNQFESAHSEIYFPIIPATAFFVDTLPANADPGQREFFLISSVSWAVLEGLGLPPDTKENRSKYYTPYYAPYYEAATDFRTLISDQRLFSNILFAEIVRKYLRETRNGQSVSRPSLDASNPVRASDFFESL